MLKDGYVYFFKHKGFQGIKIGFTGAGHTLLERFDCLQCYSPLGAIFIGYIKSTNARLLERSMHRKYASYRMNREWFNLEEFQVKKENGFISGAPIPSDEEFQPKKFEEFSIVKDENHQDIVDFFKFYDFNLKYVKRRILKLEFLNNFPNHDITSQQFYKQVKLYCKLNGLKCKEMKKEGNMVFNFELQTLNN